LGDVSDIISIDQEVFKVSFPQIKAIPGALPGR